MADMVDDLVFSFLYITPFERMLQQFIINKTLYNLLFLEQLQHKSVQVAQNGNLL